MNSVSRVKALCKERKIAISRLERELGFANGYIGQLRKGTFPNDRLQKIADYFNVPITYFTEDEKPVIDVQAVLEQIIAQLGSDAQINFSADSMPEDEKMKLNLGLQSALEEFKLYKELKKTWQDENQ
jgi:transcriptional regulator with XRE-family HTH domain